MAGRLKGKIALVTAAGQGIGRAIAEAFIAEGAKVIATDLDAGKLKSLKKAKAFRARRALDRGGRCAGQDRSIKEFGAPDILVNCAGYVHQGSVLECSEQDWDFSFDLNVKSMHRMLRAFLPAMLKNGGGSIVNISSAVSSIRGVPNRYVYGATKAAVIGLTKAVAADFIRKGIRANAICPGTIQSPSLDERIAAIAKKHRQIAQGGAQRLRRPPADRPARHRAGGRRRWRYSWRPTRRATSPGRRTWSTAAWRFELAQPHAA